MKFCWCCCSFSELIQKDHIRTSKTFPLGFVICIPGCAIPESGAGVVLRWSLSLGLWGRTLGNLRLISAFLLLFFFLPPFFPSSKHFYKAFFVFRAWGLATTKATCMSFAKHTLIVQGTIKNYQHPTQNHCSKIFSHWKNIHWLTFSRNFTLL